MYLENLQTYCDGNSVEAKTEAPAGTTTTGTTTTTTITSPEVVEECKLEFANAQ